jgi:hypothetical protein
VFVHIDQLTELVAIWVGALDIQVVVHFLERLAEDGHDGLLAPVGTLGRGVLFDPVGDTIFAEEFATALAFHGVLDNLAANDAVKGVEIESREAFSIVAKVRHFVESKLCLVKYYNPSPINH